MSDQDQTGKVTVSFLHEINKATHFLMILLEGAEVKQGGYSQYPENARKHMGVGISLSYMDYHLTVHGVGMDNILRRGGEMEQLAYKGWIVEIYRIWEDCNRKKLKNSFNVSDAILPVLPVMGDLRKIRNDFVHGDGTAKDSNKNKCEVLKWFGLGETIRLNMCNVLDFLNQIGGIGRTVFTVGTEMSVWNPVSKEQLLSRRPIPKVVSVRAEIDRDNEAERTWYLLSVVFDNGFCSHCPVLFDDSGLSLKESCDMFRKVKITPQGDLLWPDGSIKARNLYLSAVEHVDNPLTSKNADVPKGGFPGPAIRFRDPK